MENATKICIFYEILVPLHSILKVTGIGTKATDHKFAAFPTYPVEREPLQQFHSETLTLEKSLILPRPMRAVQWYQYSPLLWEMDCKGTKNKWNVQKMYVLSKRKEIKS